MSDPKLSPDERLTVCALRVLGSLSAANLRSIRERSETTTSAALVSRDALADLAEALDVAHPGVLDRFAGTLTQVEREEKERRDRERERRDRVAEVAATAPSTPNRSTNGRCGG